MGRWEARELAVWRRASSTGSGGVWTVGAGTGSGGGNSGTGSRGTASSTGSLGTEIGSTGLGAAAAAFGAGAAGVAVGSAAGADAGGAEAAAGRDGGRASHVGWVAALGRRRSAGWLGGRCAAALDCVARRGHRVRAGDGRPGAGATSGSRVAWGSAIATPVMPTAER